MAYNGYLIKINTESLNYNFIQYESYKITPNQRQDLDSFRDNNGVLHRNALQHTATKIEFNTPQMTEQEKIQLMNLFNEAFTNTIERKLTLEYYSPDTSTYKTGEFYMPDIEFPLLTEDENGVLWYDSFRIAFIEY